MPKPNSAATTPRLSSTHSSNNDEVEFIDEENLNQIAIKNNKVSFAVGNVMCTIFLLITSTVMIIIGLGIGLGLYSNFDIANTNYLKEQLMLDATSKSLQIQQRISAVEKGIDALAGPLDINTTSARLYNFSPFVKNSDVSSFVELVRNTSGSEFANFTIMQLGGQQTTTNSYYLPLLYFYSENSINNNVGVDIYSLRSNTIDTAISKIESIIASTVGALTYNGNIALRLTRAVPYINANGNSLDSIRGIVESIIMRDELFVDIKDSNLFTYLVLDLNATRFNESIIYFPERYPIQQLFSSISDLLALVDTQPLIVQKVIDFGDREWLFLTIPTELFSTQYSSNTKWIALFGSIILSFLCIFGIIICSILVINFYRTHIMTKSRMKIVLMAQINLKKLINRIANQEQKAKYILDSIRDCMLVVNTATGKIKNANKSFSLLYQYEEEDWKQLHITTVLPDLVQDFFSNMENQAEEAVSVTKAGIQYKVKVAQTSIPDTDGRYNYSLVVIRVLNDKTDLVLRSGNSVYEDVSGEILQKIKQKESVFYHLFRKFCKQEFTLDTLECIEQIEEYKTIGDVEERIKMQQRIINVFFTENAPKQVNMSAKILKKQQQRMNEGLGHINCFEQTERVLLDSLALNSYSRFMEVYATLQNQHFSSSSISTTSLDLSHHNTTEEKRTNFEGQQEVELEAVQ